MSTILSVTLLLMAAALLFCTIDIVRNLGVSDRLVRTVAGIIACAFLWCFGYGCMSLCRNFTVAYIFRAVGITGVYGVMVMVIDFSDVLSRRTGLFSRIFFYASLVGAVISGALLSLPDAAQFRITEYGTYFVSTPCLARKIELIYFLITTPYCVVSLSHWVRKIRYRREKRALWAMLLFGVLIPAGAVFDSVLPALGKTAFPVSCFTVFLATMILYKIAMNNNSIAVSPKSISHYMYEHMESPVLVVNEEGIVKYRNRGAEEVIQVGEFGRRQIYLHELFELFEEDEKTLIQEILQQDGTRDCVLIARESGTAFNLTFNRILDKFNEPICIIILIYDLTKEHRMVQKLEDMRNSLQEELDEKTGQLENVTLQAITTIANIIDAKDEYTKGHSIRVAEYAVALARRMGKSEEQIGKLHYIALLHDIGKIGVPDSVLNKPSKLTDVEMGLIQKHTTIGADILKDIKSLENAEIGAKYHHERYDGTGYPCGLAGNDIPETARIIGIADSYDAMTSDRVYRKKLSPEKVREQLTEGMGKQFDPELIRIFLELLDEGLTITEENRDEEGIKNPFAESNRLLERVMQGASDIQKTEAERDYLTNLLSRRNGEHKIMNYLQEHDGCLMVIDLDNFKNVNDKYGHLVGDYALKLVAEVLMEHSGNAIVSRMGGDEFTYFLKDVTRVEEVEPVVQGIIYTYNSKKQEESILKDTSLSIGIALSAGEGRDYSRLFGSADKALYYVKQNGKCGYSFYKSENTPWAGNESKIDLERLVAAIKHRENYQGAFKIQFREFSKIFDFVEHFTKRNNQKVQLLLFTLESDRQRMVTVEEMEKAMKCMEEAISTSLRGVDVGTRFSGTQYLVILVDTSRENIHVVTDRILKRFYQIYSNEHVLLNFDIADLED